MVISFVTLEQPNHWLKLLFSCTLSFISPTIHPCSLSLFQLNVWIHPMKGARGLSLTISTMMRRGGKLINVFNNVDFQLLVYKWIAFSRSIFYIYSFRSIPSFFSLTIVMKCAQPEAVAMSREKFNVPLLEDDIVCVPCLEKYNYSFSFVNRRP